MKIVAGQAAAEQERQGDAKPLQRSGIPGVLPRYGCHGSFYDSESCPGAQSQLDPPGYQVEVILAANLSPKRENCNHGDEELRSICQAKCGHE